jgi:hypothetical protein
MHKLFTTGLVALLFFGLTACGGTPKRNELRVEESARIEIRNGSGAEVFVDEVSLGTVPVGQHSFRFNAPSGVHRLVVRVSGRLLYDAQVFLNEGTVKVVPLGK